MSKRFAGRPRVRTVGGIAVLITASVAVLAFTAGGAAAATSGTKTYASQPATITRIGSGTTLPRGVQPNLAFLACSGLTDLPVTGTCNTPKDTGAPGTGVGAPVLTNGNVTQNGSASLQAGFNGISDVGQRTVTGYHFTPPDQALCVGPASALAPLGLSGHASVVVEGVNSAIQVYSTSGTSLAGPISLTDLFADPYASGDISCSYDPQTRTFFFTEIGAYAGAYYGTGLVSMNASGYSAYAIDTSEGGGYCFPDFPQNGFDNNAFYITVNEFCGPTEDYLGASLYGISKWQLAKHSASPNVVAWENLGLSNPIVTLRPAIGDGTSTEYLLNSENYLLSGNTLGFWQVKGDNRIKTGHGSVYLSGWEIPSEGYAQPVPALSTGDGSTCVYDFGPWCSVAEASLEPDDQRLLQVQYASGQLYTSLSTALYVGSGVVDGAAWFQVDPRTARVTHQGYVGADGIYLLYPSFMRTSSNTFVLDFSMTSPTLDPSTGYTISTDIGNSWAPITTTGEGSGPHVSFSTLQPGYMRARWGDYSAMALDPQNGSVWMADEYIPPAPDGTDQIDNWGTYVWSVTR